MREIMPRILNNRLSRLDHNSVENTEDGPTGH